MTHGHTLFDPVPHGHALTVMVLAAAAGASTMLFAAQGTIPSDGSAARASHKRLPERTVAVVEAHLAPSGDRPPEVPPDRLGQFRARATSSTMTILATGDHMFDRDVRTVMAKRGEDYLFARIRGAEDRFYTAADIVTGNLEGAISKRRAPEKTIDFAFDVSIAALLKRLGYDAVSTANNHSLDQGTQGFTDTRAALAAAGVGACGHQVRDNEPPWTTTIRGRTLAMLCYNVTDNALDEKAAEATLRAAAAAYDVVLVQVHWGAEYKPRPNAKQIALGRKFVDWGADAVIGHHPHVMEGMEIWNGRPIFWSLGNFIFDQYWSVETQRGLAVGLSVGERGMAVHLFPLISEKSQPRLALDGEDRALLATFAERSDLSEALREAAKTGILEWTF